MTDQKHTPGPWISSEWRKDGRGGGEYKEIGALHGSVWIADVRTPVEPGNGTANAHLITAAPELLAACERNVSSCSCGSTMRPDLPCGDCVLRAAIAKAKP